MMKKMLSICFVFIFIVGIFFIAINATEKALASEVFPFNGIINADALVTYDRAEMNTKYKVTELAHGNSVKVLEQAASNLYKIEYDNGKIGYVHKNYVINVDNSTLTKDSTVEGIETYTVYCDSLKATGFHESYCPYLYYLHSKYPTWKFVPDKINLTLEEAATGEEGNVVLQTGNKNYWYSEKPIEGDYYFINKQIITSFMDPRNSLFEEVIFQFLDLESSKDIMSDDSFKIIAGATGNLNNYINEFKLAGTTFGVNPLHVMARSKQEGANKSKKVVVNNVTSYVADYGAVTGTYTTDTGRKSTQGYSLDGYYNFFNIGSYKDSNYPYTVQRGLAHGAGFIGYDKCLTIGEDQKPFYDTTKCEPMTYQRPWNTPQKAISGGAEFIANTYVKMGQDTLYYQKFNIASYTEYDIYAHQYMTNIYAPMAEAKTMRSAYSAANLMNSEFTFVIPVYKDMPADNYQPVDKDSNTKLASITINDKTITGFDKDVVEYTQNYVSEKDTIKVGAKTDSAVATVTGTGDYKFVNGFVKVELVVTAENGNKATYTLNLKHVIPEQSIKVDDIVSKMGVKVDGNIMYGISPDTAVSTLINTVTKNKGSAKVVDSNGKAKNSGIYTTGDKIEIKGTVEVKTYTISVRGDINGDSKISILDLLLVQKHILGKTELKGAQYYSSELNIDNKISILDLLLVQKHILDKGKL